MSALAIPQRILDLRWLPAYAALLAAIAWSRPTPAGGLAGGGLVLAGVALRVWCAGHLVKTEQLTCGGPYAWIRHPLYLGTLLIAAGLLVAAGGPVAPWGLGLLLPVFFVYYLPYKERIESARLERRFGERYRAYRASVPALLPLGRRWPPAGLEHVMEGGGRWSAERFRASSEGVTVLVAAASLAAIALRAGLGS